MYVAHSDSRRELLRECRVISQPGQCTRTRLQLAQLVDTALEMFRRVTARAHETARETATEFRPVYSAFPFLRLNYWEHEPKEPVKPLAAIFRYEPYSKRH
jgi:hypothetical protein